MRRRGPVALIGVSSAVPTPPLMATGRLGRAQLDALDRDLAQMSTDEAFRVLLVHHPLHSDLADEAADRFAGAPRAC